MVDNIIRALNWFNLEKYDSYVRSLNYEQWLYVLWRRSEFWNHDRKIPDGDAKDIRYLNSIRFQEQQNNDYDIFINNIVSGELLDLNKLTKNDEDYNFHLEDYAVSVYNMDASSLQFHASQHSIDGMSSHEFMKKVHENDPKYINPENRHVVKYPLDENIIGDDIYITVDLNARDDVIQNDLMRLIVKERRKRNIKPRKYLTENDLKKFVNLRLLHYIDVMMVCQSLSLEVNNTLLAKILYPDVYNANPIERVRKTMPELAKNVMDESLLKASEYKHNSR